MTTNNAHADGEGSEIFWGEIAPCEHVVQIYEDDGVCLDSLERFVVQGLRKGDGVVVLATAQHLSGLEKRMRAADVDIDAARMRDQFIAVEANAALSNFMVNGWPDDDLFRAFVLGILERARKSGRQVRAFGELVAVLWARGDNAATVRLEYLWHDLCGSNEFSLFCAYPRIGFTQEAATSIREICDVHTRVFGGNGLDESLDQRAA